MKDFKKLIREAYLGNPLNEDRFKKNKDSYIRITEPRFNQDPVNPNFLFVRINYDTGPGVGIALGKETMAGQIRRLSSAEALRQMEIIAGKLEDSFDIEDIEVTDLENGVVELFAVSDDFVDMDPRSELSMALLNEEFSSTEQKMIKQIKSYKKRGSAMITLPSKVRDFYFKNKEKIDALNENMGEWPKELTSRYSDEYRFELEKVMSDRAKYRVIDIESGELKGTPVFGKPESLMAYADDLIKPQGGTQSSHFGTNEGTCGYGEDGKIGKIPAGAHLQKEESEGDKEIRALEKKAEKYPKGDSRREVIQKKIGDLKSDKDYALPGSKADKKFSDMSDKEIDDEVRRLLKRNFMEENMNDPVLVKARAAKMADEKEKAKQAALNKKYGSSFMDKLDAEINLKQELQDLKDEREQLMIDMEQEAEPEGGEIADRYGSRLNNIDAKMSVIKSELDDLRMYESVNEDEIPSYLAKNIIFGKAVEDSVNFNDFQKRVYGILGPKYYKLTDQDALKNFYDSVRVTKPNLEEDDEFNVNVDNANDNYAKAIDAESRSGAYESLQETLRKNLKNRLK